MNAEPSKERVVLVVEDDQATGELIVEAINEEPGYRAVGVMDATQALATAKRVRPDLMVLDVRLPGMSGLELYDRLQRDERMKTVPVVFETVDGQRVGRELRARGIATYLRKPFDLRTLIGYVKRLAPPSDAHPLHAR